MIHFFFVLGGFNISVWRLGKWLTRITSKAVRASYLAANILGVHLIHYVTERAEIILSVLIVNTIVDGYVKALPKNHPSF